MDPDIDFLQVWSGFAPSNVKAFAWRLLLDRLQTKHNLRRRQVIHGPEAVLCPLCNLVEESSDHLFISCPFSTTVWCSVHRWLGISSALPASVKVLFSQFPSLGRNKLQCSIEVGVWMSVCWSIWLLRNSIIFREGVSDDDLILDLIQTRSWHWIKAKVRGFHYSLFEWKTNPVECFSSL